MAFDISFEDVGFTYDEDALDAPLDDQHLLELTEIVQNKIPDCTVAEVYFTPDENQTGEIKMFACVKLRFDRDESQVSAASKEAMPVLAAVAERAWSHLSKDSHGMEGDWEETDWEAVEESPVHTDKVKS